LSGVELVISDAHTGLQAARKAVFGGVPWQRCQFHLQQNAQAFVPRQEMKREVAAAIRAIFNALNARAAADTLLAQTVQIYARVLKLATWLETAIPEGLTVFAFPQVTSALRTTNGLERLNQEIRRRTRVVGVFPNEASCLRLVTALAMETSDEWEAGKVYLSQP
jgi:transposase-like protein